MVDVRKPATLRGFDVSVADVGDQMHLCHPLIAFGNDPALYLAHRLDWIDAPETLAIADPEEAEALGTLLPRASWRPIDSGEGLVAAGDEFVRTAADVKSGLLDSFEKIIDSAATPYWMYMATPARYIDLKSSLTEAARTAFDEVFRDAVHRGRRLSRCGDAALFLMRTCASLRRDDLAIRQLAGALQNQEWDIYRRLRMGFALELDVPEDVLSERVRSHIEAVRQSVTLATNALHLGEVSADGYEVRMEMPKTILRKRLRLLHSTVSMHWMKEHAPPDHLLQSLQAFVYVAARLRETKMPYLQLGAKNEPKAMVNQVSKHAESQGERAWH